MTRVAIIAAFPGELKPLVRNWPHSTRDGTSFWAQRGDKKSGKKNGSPPVPAQASPPPRAPSPRSKPAAQLILFFPSAGPERFAPQSPPAPPTMSPESSTFAPASASTAMPAPATSGLPPAPRSPTPPRNSASPPPTKPHSSTWKQPPSRASPPCAASPSTASRA